MRKLAMFSLCAIVMAGIVGCPAVLPAAAILSGDWTGLDGDGQVLTLKFDANGELVSIEREDGVSADVSGSDSTVDGTAVTITFGSITFQGTLSADENSIAGTVDQELVVDNGNIVITIPQGDLTIDRVIVDPCADVTCADGETCVDGTCVADDPCADVTCADGETCVDGACVADDPCADVTCADGETCVDGVCEADDPCADITCADGETCVDGVCVADDPCADVTCADGETCVDGVCEADGLTGDPVAGATYYGANGCANCHGADGGGATSIIGADAALIFDKLSGAVFHVGGMFPGVTEQNAADLEAFLAAS